LPLLVATTLLSVSVACKPSGTSPSPGGTATPAPAAAADGTGPVAKVGGQDVGRQDFNRQMERTRQRFAQAKREVPPALEARLKENIIRKLVDDELIAQRAKAEGIALTPQEADAKLAEHKGRFGSPEAFKNFLERTGQAEEDLKDELIRTELRDRLFNKLAAVAEPTDDEVKDYFEKNQERYKEREQVNVMQVFFKSDKADPPDQRAKTEKRAKEAAAQLKKKGADFKALAAKMPDAAPAPGGAEGWMQKGRMPPPVDAAAFDAKVKPNDVLGPIDGGIGFYIVKVLEKKPERVKPLEEVAAAIKTTIKARQKSEKTRDLLAQLKKEAKIEVLEPGVTLEPRPVAPVPPAGAPGAPAMVPGAHPAGMPMPMPVQPVPQPPPQ
jgi:parvulin-like peptidyl-prolyl isomerase